MNKTIFTALSDWSSKEILFAWFIDLVASERHKMVAEEYVKQKSYCVEHRNFDFSRFTLQKT